MKNLTSKQGLMEDVMDLQFCLQAMLKTGKCPMNDDKVKYLLSDEFSSRVGFAGDGEILEQSSSEINEACWAVVEKYNELGIQIDGKAFNNIKPVFYAGYLKLKEVE